MPSTLNKLTEVASEKTPKPAIHAVSSQHGGVVGALSAGSLPRNESQVKSIRQKIKVTSGSSTDPLLSVMMMCKDTMKGFVRTVTGAPDYMVFIAADRSLDNLVRFCTNSSQPSILTFDPTFSLGAFDVTVSTYKHPLLVFRNPNEHTSRYPSLLGPILIHQRKQFANYHYFTSTLVGFRPEMHQLHVFGTDGEKALVQACNSQFPNAFHLRCWLHFKDNLLNKLERGLHLPRSVTQEFIADVMGNVSTLEHASAKWFTMSQDQRQRVLKRFQSVLPLNYSTEGNPHMSDPTSIDEETSQSQDSGSTSHSSHIIVNDTQSDANLLAGLGIPPYIADTIWKHARALTENDSNFAQAPGNSGKAWLVARSSSSTSKPYYVQIHKGHYECESDCIYYQACKVCAHIVAIAMKNGDLNSFLSWHKKRNHQVNTTAIAQSDLPLTSVGKKKSARKGISKQKSAKIRKICAETDDSSWNLRPALANATTVQNQLAMSVNVQSSSSPMIMPSQSSVIVPSQTYGHSSQLFPQDFAIFPAPSAPFILILLHGNISVCTGCRQQFPQNPNGDYADPPYNMAIQHMELRTFNSPITGMPTSKVGNAYYHVYLPCLHTNWPALSGRDVTVPTEFVPMLLSEHKILLYQNLGIVV